MTQQPIIQKQRQGRMMASARARVNIAREKIRTRTNVLVDSWCVAEWLGVSIYSVQDWRSESKQKKRKEKGIGPGAYPRPTPIYGEGDTSPVLYDAAEVEIIERIMGASSPAEEEDARQELDIYKQMKALRSRNQLIERKKELERQKARHARLMGGAAMASDTHADAEWGLDEEGAITGFMGLASRDAPAASIDEQGCFVGSLLHALRLPWVDLDVREQYQEALAQAGRNELEELARLGSEAREERLTQAWGDVDLPEGVERKPF